MWLAAGAASPPPRALLIRSLKGAPPAPDEGALGRPPERGNALGRYGVATDQLNFIYN